MLRGESVAVRQRRCREVAAVRPRTRLAWRRMQISMAAAAARRVTTRPAWQDRTTVDVTERRRVPMPTQRLSFSGTLLCTNISCRTHAERCDNRVKVFDRHGHKKLQFISIASLKFYYYTTTTTTTCITTRESGLHHWKFYRYRKVDRCDQINKTKV